MVNSKKPIVEVAEREAATKKKQHIQKNYKNKYYFFETNIYKILECFPKKLLSWDILLVTLIALLIRFCVGIGAYSGYNDPPKFGDFEAQRHWLELTLNLPMKDWYFYDPSHWGLDYPILTAYHSLSLAYIGEYLFGGKNRGWFALDSSRGNEDPNLKSFMRFTVCLTDIVIYIPAALWFVKKHSISTSEKQNILNTKAKKLETGSLQSRALSHLKQLSHFSNGLIILLQPSLLIIDHGHFQYNGCMLGLVLLTVNNIIDNKLVSACIFFVASLCFKQMSLYFAPVIFVYLLKQTLLSWRIIEFVSIGVSTVATFIVLYFPLYFFNQTNELGLQTLKQSFLRVFPFNRGLFEGKVANFWCVSNLFIKHRTIFSNEQLQLQSLVLTLLAASPACLMVLIKVSPKRYSKSKELLLYALGSCSLSFYLFAFQVHEKSILLPMLPMTLLFVVNNNKSLKLDGPISQASLLNSPNLTYQLLIFFENAALFSLWPLMKQEGLHLQFFLLGIMYNWLIGGFSFFAYKGLGKINKYIQYVLISVYSTMFLNLALDLYMQPPAILPDLWVVLNCAISFGCFVFMWLWLLLKMWYV
ncbi:hypothetical protein QEN19_000283 [Hanseniaspora menglaensis]